MWPWSTIRRLKEALDDKTQEAELWEKSYHRAWGLYEQAQEREAKCISSAYQQRDEALRLANAATAEVESLRTQLLVAGRNDHRNAKGRFVKAPLS